MTSRRCLLFGFFYAPSTPLNSNNRFIWSRVAHYCCWPLCPGQSSSLCSQPSRACLPGPCSPHLQLPFLHPPLPHPHASTQTSLLFFLNTHHHPRRCYIDRKFLVPAPGSVAISLLTSLLLAGLQRERRGRGGQSRGSSPGKLSTQLSAFPLSPFPICFPALPESPFSFAPPPPPPGLFKGCEILAVPSGFPKSQIL